MIRISQNNSIKNLENLTDNLTSLTDYLTDVGEIRTIRHP